MRDGREISLRAVRASDRDGFQAAMRHMSEESRYSRFLSHMRELSPQMLERATHPDATRELQLVAVENSGAREQIIGGARYSAAVGGKDCEFGIAVVDEWQGRGVARHLLEALMRAARDRGLERMEGYILATNVSMLGLARKLGFVRVQSPEDPTVHLLRRNLMAP